MKNHEKLLKFCFDHADPEHAATLALTHSWQKLALNLQPRQPDVLADILIANFVWPYPPFSPTPLKRGKFQAAADQQFARLRELALDIEQAYPRHGVDHLDDTAWSGLIMQRRPVDAQSEFTSRLLQRIESDLLLLTKIRLSPRDYRSEECRENDATIHDPFLRAFVRAVCWYLWKFECVEPRRYFPAGKPGSRHAILIDVSLRALGYSPAANGNIPLDRHLKEVRKETHWKAAEFSLFDLWPGCGPQV